jgi:hypothetical protein
MQRRRRRRSTGLLLFPDGSPLDLRVDLLAEQQQPAS